MLDREVFPDGDGKTRGIEAGSFHSRKMSEAPSISFGRLTHLLLGNFKAFKRTQRIPIRPITLIYGKNNSGKSSIIQALLYAEHVRRTGELNPATILKDGKPILDGGWSRLVHGRGKEKMIEFGWEWSNPGIGATFKSGRIRHQVRDSARFSLHSELNGDEFLSAPDGDFDPVPVNKEHPNYRAAVDTVQKWLAHEFRHRIKAGHVRGEASEILESFIPQLEAGEYAEAIDGDVFPDLLGYQLAARSFPPRFSRESRIDQAFNGFFQGYSFGKHRQPFNGDGLGIEQISTGIRWVEGNCDILEYDILDALGLRDDLESHIHAFIIDKCSYFVCEWINAVWREFSYPLGSLIDSTHYLSAVRSRPERIVFREPEARSDEKKPLGKQHRDWIWQPEAVKKANRWLKKHQALTANIELRYGEMKSRKRRGITTQASSPAESPLTLWLHDLDRGVDLNFSEAGYGLSQFIPVLLACFSQQEHDFDEPAGTLLIEEPEAHVHPALQAEIGTLFADAVTREKRPLAHIICETHSEHLLLRIMRRIREGKLSADKVSVLYVENLGNESIVREMPLNEKGELIRDWPGGFFEEGLREVLV